MRQHETPYSRIAGVPNVQPFRLQQLIPFLGGLFSVNSPDGRIVNPRLSADTNPRNPFSTSDSLPTLYRPVNQR